LPMQSLSKPTIAKILAEVSINLSSGWFGILLVSPGLFSISSIEEYLRLLTINLPFGIFGLAVAYLLLEWSKKS